MDVWKKWMFKTDVQNACVNKMDVQNACVNKMGVENECWKKITCVQGAKRVRVHMFWGFLFVTCQKNLWGHSFIQESLHTIIYSNIVIADSRILCVKPCVCGISDTHRILRVSIEKINGEIWKHMVFQHFWSQHLKTSIFQQVLQNPRTHIHFTSIFPPFSNPASNPLLHWFQIQQILFNFQHAFNIHS